MTTAASTGSNPQAPDGTPHRIDFETFVRLGELGVYPTRSELIDGIVYDTSPKGDAHYFARAELLEQLSDARAGRYRAGPEPTLKLDDANGPMPDVLVTPRDAEVGRYARAGVREYWVVDLRHEAIERYVRRRRDRSDDF